MEVISFSQQEVLNEVSSPETVEEYEQYISLLTECISLVDNHKISIKKHQLENELIILKDILSIIDNSSSLYDNGEYSESFMTLALGLDKYPKNELLSTSLVDFHDHYIIHITKQVNSLCEEKEYSVALNIIDEAINEYNCNEFIILKESVKEQKNFFYRLKNNIVDKFNAYSPGWTSEELDVKQMANTAGSYAVKSGKNLILGDYSGEDITVLSFTGNMVAALAGVDWIFDLRDISYDLAHWGEDEYFAIYLATDVVALLPVVGAIKYFNHFKTATDGLKTAADLADSVSDMNKNAEKAADIVDTLSPTLKNSDELIDAIDNAKAISKVDKVDDICLNIKKGYEYQDTINSRYAGKLHPETGIKYNLEKIEYSDGRKIQAVFPDFDSYADIELPKDLYKAPFDKQKEYCLEELNKRNKTLFSSTKKQFTEQQLDDIANGMTPSGYTWHHNEEEGLMQLVDSAIHQDTRHTGGMSLWGIGY